MSELKFPTVVNPQDNIIYVDDPYSQQPTYEIPLMDAKEYIEQLNGGSKAASTVSLERIYYNSGGSNHPEFNFLDIANMYYDKIIQARSAPTKKEQISRAGAIITSLDYKPFQDQNTIALNQAVAIKTGILTGLFETIAVPNLSAKWQTMTNNLKYHRNIMESKSPEPSKGFGTIQSISVQKHGGAVAITQRAELVINGTNPFPSLVAEMNQVKARDENDMVADLIEAQTANTLAGVDFGLRAGVPPASSTNPIDFLNQLTNTFESLRLPMDLFVSRGFIYNEYITNDIVRGGINNIPPEVGNVNETVGGFPLLGSVRWARDNAITSTNSGWAMNSNAIKNFRGPSRNYTIANEDTETTKYVTKNYYNPAVVEPSLIYKITGIAA